MNNNSIQTKNRTELTEKVIAIIFTALNLSHIDKKTVTADTAIMQEGLKLDSIDILELVVQFENHFKFKFQENESYKEHFQNIGTIVNFIDSKKTTS